MGRKRLLVMFLIAAAIVCGVFKLPENHGGPIAHNKNSDEPKNKMTQNMINEQKPSGIEGRHFTGADRIH